MAEKRPIEPDARLGQDVVDVSPASDPATVREVFRANNSLAVSVMERREQYNVRYSLGDLHRLTFLSHEERTAVQKEWHAWHRQHVRLSTRGVLLWTGAAAVAWVLWFRIDGAIATAVATVVTIGLVMTLRPFVAAITAPVLCDAYLRGYSDGLTRGVNRALRITPEVEQQMWEELRQAEELDAVWRRATKITER